MKHKTARKKAKKTYDEWAAVWHSKVEKVCAGLTLNRLQRRKLDALLKKVVSQDPRYSSDIVREAVFSSLQATLDAHVEQRADVKFYLGTACFDAGLTYENEPSVDVDRIIKRLRDDANTGELDAIFFPDVDPFTRPFEGENWRRISVHFHFVVMGRVGKFQPIKVAKQLNRDTAFTNSLGPVYTLRSKRQQTPETVAGLALYCTKPIARGKKRVWRDKTQKYTLLHDKNGFSRRSALRLKEVLSYFPVYTVVFSVGDIGKELRRQWKRQMRRRLAKLPNSSFYSGPDFETADVWADVWADDESFKPCRIKVRAKKPRDPSKPKMSALIPHANYLAAVGDEAIRLGKRSSKGQKTAKARRRFLRGIYRFGRFVASKRLGYQVWQAIHNRDGEVENAATVNDFSLVMALVGDGHNPVPPDRRAALSDKLNIAHRLGVGSKALRQFMTTMSPDQIEAHREAIAAFDQRRYWDWVKRNAAANKRRDQKMRRKLAELKRLYPENKRTRIMDQILSRGASNRLSGEGVPKRRQRRGRPTSHKGDSP